MNSTASGVIAITEAHVETLSQPPEELPKSPEPTPPSNWALEDSAHDGDAPLDRSTLLATSEIHFLDPEPAPKRYAYAVVALALAAGFFFTVSSYWVPAHPGTDQNGYLVGGKMFAQTLSTGLAPIHPGTRHEFDPHQFVGRMWVGADLGTSAECYYPKYPAGLSVLYAILLWVGIPFHNSGTVLAYWLSPTAMALAVFAAYLVARRFAGSFGGLLAAIVFATSPVTLGLATNPNSHAAAVCFVTWGMYLLICFWQKRGAWRALLAGFLLGSAATIRYSGGTLILPIALVALFTLRWRDWKSLRQAAALVIAWTLPVAALILYNHTAMGATTGYDPTNESTGFRWSYAADNWETMLRQINTNGLSFLLPLALAGLVWMFWWNWRAASVITAWIVPCILIYTFYYWAPDGTSIGYLRFFTTILPALALCFYWLVKRLDARMVPHSHLHFPMAVRVTLILLVSLIGFTLGAWGLTHAWLWEHDPATIGLSQANPFLHFAAPALTEHADNTSPREALVAGHAAVWGVLAITIGAALLATAFTRGRSIVPTIGAGFLTAIVVAMHLVNALPSSESDQLQRIQLNERTQAILTAIPPGSVVICQDQQLLNHLQFVADYMLYEGASFRRDWVQNLPNAEPADQPQGLDPGRRDALFNRLKNADQNALDEQARRIINDSLTANRRVFYLLTRRDGIPPINRRRNALAGISAALAPAVRDRFMKALPEPVRRVCSPDRFNTEIAETWPGYVPRTMLPQTSRTRGAMINRLVANPERQTFEIVEVTRKK